VRIWDAVIVGAGIIGLSLAIELRKTGMSVLVIEKGEPGREASWAAGGMLADFGLEIPSSLQALATASARLYPEFVHELEDESGLKIDLRPEGTLLILNEDPDHGLQESHPLPTSLETLEPALQTPAHPALFLNEQSVDPRHLTAAAIAAARHRGVDFSSGDPVLAIEIIDGKAAGVRTNRTRFASAVVVNCAGAWAGQIGYDARVGTDASPVQAEHTSAAFFAVPTRPVKGQMLCVAMPEKNLVRHVVRTANVYLIPRSDGRLLIGATQEEAGFDKQTVPQTLQKLRQAALDLVPKLADARILEAWAGLRPGTPDKLPILGATPTPGYYAATGHFRDGILLAPITAKSMASLISGGECLHDLSAFTAARFHLLAG
jgi:glycine oxidase